MQPTRTRTETATTTAMAVSLNLLSDILVHFVAPALVPVFVIESSPHDEHEATFEDKEYLPGVQRVHVVAPMLVPVFVLEPAPHN